MIINKYNPWRKALLWLQHRVPAAKRLKNVAPRFKEGKYRERLKRYTEARRDAIQGGGRAPLFTHVEIETINRCNGECNFCPVNRHRDPRPAARMTDEMFYGILDQLRALDYREVVHLYSNNEPLLDVRIFDFAKAAREALPHAKIHCYTNGLLLDMDKYRRLIDHVDILTINNYCHDFRFPAHIQEVIDYSSRVPQLDFKTRVTMRYLGEVMTSRGGQSPNKQDILPNTKPFGCFLPAFQFIIRPNGDVSLCCNDALGAVTLGNVGESGVEGVWYDEKYQALRGSVLESRHTLPICRHCDTMIGK